MIQIFTLTKKKVLTHDVYEMHYLGEKNIEMQPGQFITFLINGIGGRAYSILHAMGRKIILIIKKRELQNQGRGGSKYLCEMNIGDTIKGVGPAGSFLLRKNNKNKMFIATGTGMVPLYNQILSSIQNNPNIRISFVFGIRMEKDLFYRDKFEEIKKNHKFFDYVIFLSREFIKGYTKGYVTDYLIKENISDFGEFYICGANSMIDSSIEKIKTLGVDKQNILFERYS